VGRLRRAGQDGRDHWARLPIWARWVLAGYIGGFTDGTAAHVRDLAGRGLHAYSSFHQPPFQVFFVGLVVLDPLAVILAALARPAAAWLGAAVMAADMTANWVGNWPWPSHYLMLWPITGFGVFVLATAPALHRQLRAACLRTPLSPAGQARTR
jgi:hypothetical protein